MKIAFPSTVLLAIILSLPLLAFGQTRDVGAIGSIAVSKRFDRFGLALEQELRTKQQLSTMDRALTAVGLDYMLLPKTLKAELEYDFIYQEQKYIYEFRHRGSIGFSALLKSSDFNFKIRTRFQSTWRDENRGDYNFNPKYVWRNKVECAYTIFGSPIKPFVSGEAFAPTNGANGFYMDSYRLCAGIKYRLTMRNTLQVMVRYDQDIQKANPESILYGYVGWEYEL